MWETPFTGVKRKKKDLISLYFSVPCLTSTPLRFPSNNHISWFPPPLHSPNSFFLNPWLFPHFHTFPFLPSCCSGVCLLVVESVQQMLWPRSRDLLSLLTTTALYHHGRCLSLRTTSVLLLGRDPVGMYAYINTLWPSWRIPPRVSLPQMYIPA